MPPSCSKMAQDGAKTAQDGSKTAKDGPEKSQDGPKMSEDGAKMDPRLLEKVPRWPKIARFDTFGKGLGPTNFKKQCLFL